MLASKGRESVVSWKVPGYQQPCCLNSCGIDYWGWWWISGIEPTLGSRTTILGFSCNHYSWFPDQCNEIWCYILLETGVGLMNKSGLVARHKAGTSTEWGYYMYWIKLMRDSVPMSLVYIHKETWLCYSTSPFRYWLISTYSWWCNMMRLVRNIPTRHLEPNTAGILSSGGGGATTTPIPRGLHLSSSQFLGVCDVGIERLNRLLRRDNGFTEILMVRM